MALNASDEAIIAHRRELVARLRLRGYSQREIVAALATGELKFLNPETGQPWSLGTINSDLKALQAQWRREAKKTIDTHKARQLAELAEVRRQAWLNNDLASVLRSIRQEMTLLGTEAPKRQDNLNFDLDVTDLPDDVIERLARGEKVDLAAITSQSRTRAT